ncbi:MAG: hypothetical protein R2774_10655 [Saprospiraceae bacterium]
MQYLKITVGETIIEIHNSWLGQETITANGRVVSVASSLYGHTHSFVIQEKTGAARYEIITKIMDALMNVGIDVIRNGKFVYKDLHIPYASKPSKSITPEKKKGLEYLRNFDINEAIQAFQDVLNKSPYDWETHFHIACAYSNKEVKELALQHLSKAVEYGLNDTDIIMTHEMLAYIRIQEEFAQFIENDFHWIEG